jgi:hypothetical protein
VGVVRSIWTSSTSPPDVGAGHNPFDLAVGVARSVEDFYEPFRVCIGAGHNPLGLAVGVARSAEDVFYEPFQVLGLAIILFRPGCGGGAQH